MSPAVAHTQCCKSNSQCVPPVVKAQCFQGVSNMSANISELSVVHYLPTAHRWYKYHTVYWSLHGWWLVDLLMKSLQIHSNVDRNLSDEPAKLHSLVIPNMSYWQVIHVPLSNVQIELITVAIAAIEANAFNTTINAIAAIAAITPIVPISANATLKAVQCGILSGRFTYCNVEWSSLVHIVS